MSDNPLISSITMNMPFLSFSSLQVFIRKSAKLFFIFPTNSGLFFKEIPTPLILISSMLSTNELIIFLPHVSLLNCLHKYGPFDNYPQQNYQYILQKMFYPFLFYL